jgi:protein-S-isoprenylcysteine O-methyltransferase Ste14
MPMCVIPSIRGLSWLLLQWSILLTLGMFPVLVWMYLPLARQDEADERAAIGDAYRRYAAAVPAFVPHLGKVLGFRKS